MIEKKIYLMPRDKMSTISSDNEDTILLPRQTEPTIPYPIALSHDFEWEKCKDCGTCDHYANCILDEVHFRIFYPRYLLCQTCEDSVAPRKQYLLTDDMKTTYFKDRRCTKCLACQSEHHIREFASHVISNYLRPNVQQKL